MTRDSRTAAIVSGACLSLIAILTAIVVAADGPTGFDRSLSTWVAEHRSSALVSTMEAVTYGGSAQAIWIVGIGCAIWSGVRRSWMPFAFVIPTTLLAWLTTNWMKVAIARPRPTGEIPLHHFSGYSFPSGHATASSAVWGALAVALIVWSPLRARWVAISWAGLILGVSASRVVLGAHWLTDVVAGTAMGTAFVAAATVLAGVSSPRPPRDEPGPAPATSAPSGGSGRS